MRKKTLDYLWGISYMNVCIHGYNCCQTGDIELSKCVNLVSRGVKIEHTVGVQNKDFFQNAYLMVMSTIGRNQSQNCENLCFSPSNLNDIYGKLNKIDFCYKFCRICPLGWLAAIIIDILPQLKVNTEWRPQSKAAFCSTHILPWSHLWDFSLNQPLKDCLRHVKRKWTQGLCSYWLLKHTWTTTIQWGQRNALYNKLPLVTYSGLFVYASREGSGKTVQMGSLTPASTVFATHWAHIEDSDQTGRMPRLIWVFSGRTCHFCWFCHEAAQMSLCHGHYCIACLGRIGYLHSCCLCCWESHWFSVS